MIDINELRQALGAVTTEEVEELINRLEASESDGLEQARLLGMSGEREAALTAKLEAAEKERDALRARIERVEKQEPAFWWRQRSDGAYEGPIHSISIEQARKQSGAWSPLCALPGAQPAPSVPDHKTIRDLLNESGLCAYDRAGDLAFMVAATKFAALAAAPKPEAKP